jgi:hypothetical protein
MPRLTSEERASISKVDQWIIAGGGKAPEPGQALPGLSTRPQQWSTKTQPARRAGVYQPRPRPRAKAVLGPDEPDLFFVPEVLVANPGGEGAGPGRVELGRPDPRPALRSLDNGAANTAEQAAGGLLDASSVVSGFMTGFTALLSGAGTDAVKNLAYQGLFGPAKLAIAPDSACRQETSPPKRPRPSGKEQLPLGTRPLLQPSIASAHIGVDPPGARRAAKARRMSALF